MRENRLYGSEGGAAELNRSSLPLSRQLSNLFVSAPLARMPAGWSKIGSLSAGPVVVELDSEGPLNPPLAGRFRVAPPGEPGASGLPAASVGQGKGFGGQPKKCRKPLRSKHLAA